MCQAQQLGLKQVEAQQQLPDGQLPIGANSAAPLKGLGKGEVI